MMNSINKMKEIIDTKGYDHFCYLSSGYVAECVEIIKPNNVYIACTYTSTESYDTDLEEIFRSEDFNEVIKFLYDEGYFDEETCDISKEEVEEYLNKKELQKSEKENSDTTIRFNDEYEDRYKVISTTSEIFLALADIVYYQGYEEDLISLKAKLKLHYEKNSEKKESFCRPEHYQSDSQFHMYWMILVGCFGEWGTSIRSGWIWYENIPYAIRFIERLLEC